MILKLVTHTVWYISYLRYAQFQSLNSFSVFFTFKSRKYFLGSNCHREWLLCKIISTVNCYFQVTQNIHISTDIFHTASVPKGEQFRNRQIKTHPLSERILLAFVLDPLFLPPGLHILFYPCIIQMPPCFSGIPKPE